MKKYRTGLLLIIAILTTFNILWFVHDYKRTKRDRYNSTYDCEQKELVHSLRNFEIGMTYTDFNKKITSQGFDVSKKWNNKDYLYIEIRNMLLECPASNRPYCGILFSFKIDKLEDIQIGYPCH